ncbi:hypothetical protein GCM10010452_68140 [Crossiella cryophila]
MPGVTIRSTLSTVAVSGSPADAKPSSRGLNVLTPKENVGPGLVLVMCPSSEMVKRLVEIEGKAA